MSTSLPATPTFPLTPDQRLAYQDLYDKDEAAVQQTAEPDLLAAFIATRDGIGAVISADNVYRLNQDTAAFATLAQAFKTANDAIKKLQDEIAKVNTNIERFAEVTGAITKILSMVPGI